VCGDALGLRQAEVHVTARIREFVVDTFLLGDDDGFDDDDSLIDGGIVDSTGVMELVSFLEQTYGIAIEDRELVAANLDSITRLRAFVDGKLAATAPAGAAPEAEDAAV
jgi:acyl carrier protein